MCVIINKFKDVPSTLEDKDVENASEHNADGIGVMWVEEGRVKFRKSVGNTAEQMAIYADLKDKEAWCVHFRLRTHGATNEDNCHPFRVLNIDEGDPVDLYLMHNGIISSAPTLTPDMSDTYNFVEHMLRPILKADPTLIDNEQFQKLIEGFIGTGNKLVLLRSDGTQYILNKRMGDDHKGCWVSNKHSFREKYKYNQSNVGYRNNFSYYNSNDYAEYYGNENVCQVTEKVSEASKGKEQTEVTLSDMFPESKSRQPESSKKTPTLLLPKQPDGDLKKKSSTYPSPNGVDYEDFDEEQELWEEAFELDGMYSQDAVTLDDVVDFVYNSPDDAALLLAYKLNKNLFYKS